MATDRFLRLKYNDDPPESVRGRRRIGKLAWRQFIDVSTTSDRARLVRASQPDQLSDMNLLFFFVGG